MGGSGGDLQISPKQLVMIASTEVLEITCVTPATR